jgi:Tfp pilus assembly protein FimT
MKTFIASSRRAAGVLLIECLVYIAIYGTLTGVGFAAFYLCWNQSRAVVFATDDIANALRTGERWRADIRSAVGPIALESAAGHQTVRIPETGKEVVYRFAGNEVHRETSVSANSELLLSRVNTSVMSHAPRDGAIAWRWEVQVSERRPEPQLPLLFTFEAAAKLP